MSLSNGKTMTLTGWGDVLLLVVVVVVVAVEDSVRDTVHVNLLSRRRVRVVTAWLTEGCSKRVGDPTVALNRRLHMYTTTVWPGSREASARIASKTGSQEERKKERKKGTNHQRGIMGTSRP